VFANERTDERVAMDLVGADSVRSRQRDLARLKIADLTGLGVCQDYYHADSPDLGLLLPNLTKLILDESLFASWAEVCIAVSSLEQLRFLSLRGNRFSLPGAKCSQTAPALLSSLQSLVLNDTQVDTQTLELAAQSTPNLLDVHLASNHFTRLNHALAVWPRLQLIDLCRNQLSDWSELDQALRNLPHLTELRLSQNHLPDLEPCEHDPTLLSSLKTIDYLWIDGNRLTKWSSLVVLLRVATNLTRLRLDQNPVTMENGSAMTLRYLTIAHAHNVVQVNGAQISLKERTEAEKYFLKWIQTTQAQQTSHDELPPVCPFYEDFLRSRYQQLVEVHGAPTPASKETTDSLADQIVDLTIFFQGSDKRKRLPRSVSIGDLRTLCASLFKIPSIQLQLCLQVSKDDPMPTSLDSDSNTLDYYGVTNESTLHVMQRQS